MGDEYARRLTEAAKDVAELVTSAGEPAARAPLRAAGRTTPAPAPSSTRPAARLYRRPLTAAETARYLALYTKVRQGGDFKSWVYWATVALMKSPNTVYRSELGEAVAGGRFRLSPYEVASELSYVYTGGPPTPELLQLAAANRLATADQVEAAARTLVLGGDGTAPPAFRNLVAGFAEQWLGLSPLENIKKDATAFPTFAPEVQRALGEETRRFLSAVLFDDKGKPADLLVAPFTFVDATLARYYGFGQAAAGAGFARADAAGGLGRGSAGAGVAAGHRRGQPQHLAHQTRSPGARADPVQQGAAPAAGGGRAARTDRGRDHPPALRGDPPGRRRAARPATC